MEDLLRYVWLMPALMGLSFVTILLFGKRLPKKGAEVGIASVGLCLLMALGSAVAWIDRVENPPEAEHAASSLPIQEDDDHAEEGATEGEHGEAGAAEGEHAAEGEEHHEVEPVMTEQTWWSNGDLDIKVGTFVDGLSVMMLVVVTIISLLVHVYSTDYVGGDRRYTHYFAFLSLFTSSMLLLVMSRNTVQFITAWELVGVCSFALIGHWWEEKPNSDAALKAFLTNRVGDIGLLVGMIVLFFAAGSFDIREINELAVAGEIRHLLLLVASCCLVAAVMSKSGQFVLHTWLPDAMAGPTPVSALIHAATMVVAGIFMVARFYGVFFEGLSIGTGNLNLLAVVGAVTLLGGGALAFVQSDIKKVLAYSTVSQLGYMAMGLGVGAWTAALFHLFTHAFFKAGLFLGSGSVAHSIHSFDMKKDMGGMKRFMPRTYVTFVICSLALAAIPPLAGFWSKDEILAGASQLGGGGDGYPLMLWAGIIGGGMTAAYMTRCVYLTFHGEPRGHAADPHHPPHESGPRILVPLYILAALAVVAGFANLPGDGIFPDGMALRFEHYVEPVAPYFPGELPTFAHPHFSWWVAIASTAWAVVAASLAYAYWFLGRGHGATERNRFAHAGHTLLVEKYYFDHLYTGVVAGGVKGPLARAAAWFNQNVLDGIVNGIGAAAVGAARFTYKYIDQGVVDGAVNGSGYASEGFGQALRRLQTGRVQQYGALLFGGAVLLAGIFVFAI